MSLHEQYWKRSLNLNSIKKLTSEMTLSGYSRAAYRSGFRIDELQLYLDAGLSTFENINLIAITHGHGDHVFALGSMLMCPRREGAGPIRTLMPQASIDTISKYAHSFFDANFNKRADLSKIAKFEGVRPRTEINHSFSKSSIYKMQIFKMFHGIPTVGYGLTAVQKYINPILSSLMLPQNALTKLIMKIKKQQVITLEDLTSTSCDLTTEQVQKIGLLTPEDINITVDVPQMAYLVDTSIKIFTEEYTIVDNVITKGVSPQGIFKYPIIIIECTFYDPVDLPEAKKKNHIHWQEIEPYIRNQPENHFILVHSSLKCSDTGIKDVVGYGLTNVHIWLEEGPWHPLRT